MEIFLKKINLCPDVVETTVLSLEMWFLQGEQKRKQVAPAQNLVCEGKIAAGKTKGGRWKQMECKSPGRNFPAGALISAVLPTAVLAILTRV